MSMSEEPSKKRRRGHAGEKIVDRSPLQTQFAEFREVLDQRDARIEAVYKQARDVIKMAKKAIFAELRHASEHGVFRNDSEETQLDRSMAKLFEQSRKIFGLLDGDEVRRFAFKYTFALEECIEAACVHYFRKTKSLLPPAQLCELIGGPVSNTVYVLGVADIGGELMRMATNAIVRKDAESPRMILDFLRELMCHTEAFTAAASVDARTAKSLQQKVQVLHQSVKKVERLCYDVRLREVDGRDSEFDPTADSSTFDPTGSSGEISVS
ncbi:MAG: hypothetical protein MHM6MM_004110 [Cercozoa sp. M6MM]